MNVYDAIKKRRTVRKFLQKSISENDLMQIIDSARLAPFGANLQPLKFLIVTDRDTRQKMYPHIKYAGYIPEWNPDFEECPPVFAVVLNDTNIKPTSKSECDSGAAIMSMCLAATELVIDSCWLGAVDRTEIKKLLGISDSLDITYLLGLGYGAQTGEVYDSNETIKYSFDAAGNVHVPKRPMDDVMLGIM